MVSNNDSVSDWEKEWLELMTKDPEKCKDYLRRLKNTPPSVPIPDLVPLDELEIRLDLIASIVKKMQKYPGMAKDGINDFSFAALLVAPLRVLQRLELDHDGSNTHPELGKLLDATDSRLPCTVKSVLQIFLNKAVYRDQDRLLESKDARIRRQLDGHACKVMATAEPHVCHIIPWFAVKDHPAIDEFGLGLGKMVKTLGLAVSSHGTANNPEAADAEATQDRLTELFCSTPGCSSKYWNAICLNVQLHYWWRLALIGLRPLGILGRDSSSGEKKVRVQLYWMPSHLRPKGTRYEAKVMPRDAEGLRRRLDEIRTASQRGLGAARMPLESHHLAQPVETGDILEWSVKTAADAEKMMRAFELQWALVRIVAIAGGGEDDDY